MAGTRSLALTPALLALLACGGAGDAGHPAARDSVAADPRPYTGNPTGAAPAPEATDSALLAAARGVIAFLRGAQDLPAIGLSDTVFFHVPLEGGGGRTAVARERLRARGNWRVRLAGGEDYVLAPPPPPHVLTARVGQHFNCMASSLASRLPELAAYPHVGTRLQPARAESCLMAWNLTLVFESGTNPPLLRAVVYDQWEW